MTPATTQSELFSESHWLKIGPHPTKDMFLTPPPLPQWIFYVALSMSISCSQYRTVVTSHSNQAIARCLDQAIVIIYASLWPPLAQVPVSAISDISGQWWSTLVQLSLALSLISISSLSLTRPAIELIPVTVSSPLIGWKVAPEPSHWPYSYQFC